MSGQAGGGWWGGREGDGQEALGCLFPLFPDSFVAAGWLPSFSASWLPAHFRSYALSLALSLAQGSFSKPGLLGTGTPR